MAWWLNRGGRPEGPYQEGQIFQLIQSGQLRGAHIAEDGGAGWLPIEQHPVFGPAMRGGAGPMAQPPPGQPALAHTAPARKKSGSRVAIIVGAVLGAILLVGAGLFFGLRGSDSGDDESGLDPKETARRAAACKKSVAAIKKIDASAVPPVETDGYLDKSVYVSFSFDADRVVADDHRSVLIIHAEDLKEPGLYRSDLAPRVPGSSAVTGCANALASYEESKKEKKREHESFMKGCTKLEYLAVVRVREHVEPKITSTNEDETTNTRTHIFDPGKITGDVVVFSLQSGKPMGGFAFAAESSEKPERTFDGKDLQTDLLKQLVKALEAGDERARAKARGGS